MSQGFRFIFVLTLILPCVLWGAGFGSKGFQYVQTASTLQPQRVDFRTNLRFYTTVARYLGEPKPADFVETNLWNVQSNLLFTYGLAEHFDATATLRLYQDIHREGGRFFRSEDSNFPDDIFLDIKGGGFGFSENRMEVGAEVALRLPIADIHNYPFEKYNAGAVEFGMNGLFSYYNDPFLHDRDYSFHLNFGYYYYNDKGKIIYEDRNVGTIVSQTNSSSLEFGAAFNYPTELFDLSLELWGSTFATRPDTFAFSREDWLYLTPTIRYKPSNRFSFDIAFDIRLSSDEQTTTSLATFEGQNLDIPNYAPWKMSLAANFVINPGQDLLSRGINTRGDVRKRVDFYERLLQEREESRSIEEELRRLKREREQAEKELEELKQLLEEEGR